MRAAGSLLLVGALALGCAAEPSGDSAPAPSSSSTPPASRDALALVAPEPAGSPASLARRLVLAERTVRGGDAEPAALRQAAFETQVLYRQLARRETWHAPVLRDLPPRLRAAARAHVLARREFRSMHAHLSDTLPAWRIVAPAPADDLLRFYRQGQRRHGVPWEVLAAVNLVETGMGRIRGTSVAGARGPMQFMPATWEAYGRGDIDDPHDAILAAARYLAANGAGKGRLDRALYAYNHSASYVAGVKAYAGVLRADPRAYAGLYHWQVVYLSSRGDVWLPRGYVHREPVPVRRYLRDHPDHHLGGRTD